MSQRIRNGLFAVAALSLSGCALFAAPAGATAQDEGTLVVRVTTNTGAVLVGANVTIPSLSMGRTTGSSGIATISGVPAGMHEGQAGRIGYETATFEVTITAGEETRINIQLNEAAVMAQGLAVVGSRGQPRTVTESPVPVDVISSREIVEQGDSDMANLVRNVVPSFNVNIQPISDAATFARPANLRGLAPDHTLLLLNGKRRHRTAVITWYGNGLADGSQGPDIAVIPGMALRQVEVLRDGAAAQYGSDAIAGVMNFALKNDRSGGALELKTGAHLLDGDGEAYTLTGNIGLPMGANGFLNLTGEYGNSNPTDRSVQRDDAIALINAGNTSVREPAQIWGSPEVSNDFKLWANTGYLFDNGMEFYGHGNYVTKQVEGGFYFRNPNTRNGVFGNSAPEGDSLLVGDLLDAADGVLDGSAGCPRVAVEGGVVTDIVAWNQVLNDPNCFTFQKLFPGGFTPQFGSYVLDASVVAGLRGSSEKFAWDVSGSWGNSNMDFYMYNTVNASLGPDQPCSDKGTSSAVPEQDCTPYFNPGTYDQQESNINVDVAYTLNDRVNLAGGGEWRNERFQIVQGDEASWTEGPLANQGFTPGSNGFTGFGPLTEGVWNRNNFAAYSDLEIRGPGGAWTLGVAGRIENFSDFGTTVNGKVAGLFSVSNAMALRGAISTGFRAPTPGQQNAFNISTIYDFDLMDLTNNGTIPSTSALAMEYGGEDLRPEQSMNLSVGAVYEAGLLTLSGDFFLINVTDRLTTSQNFALSDEDVDRLLEEEIIRPGGVLRQFRFFVNDFATRTTGFDLVGAYDMSGGSGVTTLSTAWNYTSTEVTDYDPKTLNDTRIRILQEGLPNLRGNVAVTHRFGDNTRLLVRGSHWGGYFDGETPYYEESDPENTIDFPARQLYDVEVAHTFMDNWTVTLGGQNALNIVPAEYPGASAGVGNRYGQFTPFGFNGAFYYGKLSYSW